MSAFALRDYQAECIRAIRQEWQSVDRTLVVASTGSGKSIIALGLIDDILQDEPNARFLFQVHRTELATQPLEKMERFMPHLRDRAGLVMAENDESDAQIVVATVQTLSSGSRLETCMETGAFDYIISDECFVAGTLVDGRPIESLGIGDEITAWLETNHVCGLPVRARVTRAFKREAPDSLVRISLCDGTALTCTPEHAFWTNRGWIQARSLCSSDYVVRCATIPLGEDHGYSQMLYLRERVRADEDTARNMVSERETAHLLFSRMRPEVHRESLIAEDGENESQVCQRADEAQEPDAQSQSARQSQDIAARYGLAAASAWRQREAIACSAADARVCSGMGNRGDRADKDQAGRQPNALSDIIQSGHRERATHDSYRSRRKLSLCIEAAGARPQEGNIPALVRVGRVEVLEQGRDRAFERMCPDGFVYNLEVDGPNTYTVDGIVVHNCHHDCSPTRLALLDRMRGKVCGFTATPMRTDGDGLRKVYQSVAMRMPIGYCIDHEILVPFDALGFSLPVSLSGLRETADGWEHEPLGDLLKAENVLEIILTKWRETGGDERLTMGFTASVAQAHASAAWFSAHGIPSEAADGNTPKDERAAILDRFRRGETRLLWNCALWTEGYDCPEMSCVIMAAPTKSDLLYVQRMGRALRTFPEKRSALVLDFAPLNARDLVLAGDVLGQPRQLAKAQKRAEDAGILIGALHLDQFGVASTIDPCSVVCSWLNYLSRKSSLAWTLDGNLATATLSADAMLAVALPDVGRIAKGEALKRSGQWSEREEHLLRTLKSTRLVLIEKVGGRWQAKTLGHFTAEDEAKAEADRVAERLADPMLAKRAQSWRRKPASDAQIRVLRHMGVLTAAVRPGDYDRGKASQMISDAIAHGVALQHMRQEEARV